MMQKYTLNIADIELSLRSDASPAEVERIRGLLDRKMREIYLVSRCPKSEAALLCAMDFCADRKELQEKADELEERCDKYAIVLDSFKERTAELTAEVERLKNENAVLRSLITTGGPVAPDPISPTAFLAEVAEAQNQATPAEERTADETAETPVEDATETIDANTAENASEKAPEQPATGDARNNRSRVGSMFDLLSFGEVE